MQTLTSHQLAALNFNKHISLTANAGSGKTFVLSRRYLEIAVAEDIPLRNIAAITFTDKAASELYNKIARQLEERLAVEKDSRSIKKLLSLRRQLVSANISTIHSFCINILREFPVEAGLDANFTPIDERVSGELIELSVEELIKAALEITAESDGIKYLIRNFASKAVFARELGQLIRNRKNVISLADGLYTGSNEEIALHFYETYLHLMEELFLSKKDQLISHLSQINNTVLNNNPGNEKALGNRFLLQKLNAEKDTENILLLINEIKKEFCTSNGNIIVRGYLKKDVRPEVENSAAYCEDFFAGYPAADLSNHYETELELARFGKMMVHFFYKAVSIYEEKKRENGYLDYEDILLFTKEILENNDVREQLSQKFKYIMIDEYQDTNELQYEIFLPVLDYLKKGNLFVVGDEKQSIYMFRDAELEIFSRTKIDIKKESGDSSLLSLPDSFRMAPGLCLFTNYLFRNLFSSPNPVFNEVEHSDLVCAGSTDINAGRIEILSASEDENNGSTEAELTARRVLLLKQEKNLPWKDIAVLCRKRKSFSELEKAFSLYKIPFSILGGKGFYQKQMVYDVFSYFSFLLDINNDAALAGILRSPFFSFSDTALLEISLQPGKTLWHKLKQTADSKQKYSDEVRMLAENIKMSNSLDIPSLLRKILNESHYLSVLSSRPEGTQEIANIEKLIQLSISLNARGYITIYDYVTFLKNSIEQEEDEAQAAIADDSDSVKIMTYHQAKGLEFSAVFLYKSADTSKVNRSKSKTVIVNKQCGLLTKVPVNSDYFSEYKAAPVIEISNYILSKKNYAELKRLFYVGVTRAKNYLFISAEKREKYSSESFAGMLYAGLNEIPGKAEYKITSELEFLTNKEGQFYNGIQKFTVSIPVVTSLPEPVMLDAAEPEYQPKKILLNRILDKTKGEIISATKLAVYTQCPVKYKLTYELGYQSLYNRFKDWKKDGYEFTDLEDLVQPDDIHSERNLSNIKGIIIHKLLQREIPPAESECFIESEVKNELNGLEFSSARETLYKDIINDIKAYYNSQTYLENLKYADYRNEFEVYLKEEDYFLYGIIDKLVFDGKTVIIIDYKTDDIEEKEIEKRGSVYLTQLKFYSYIVSRFFNNITQFKLKLIFIKHPDVPFIYDITPVDIYEIRKQIARMVNDVRENSFIKNSGHCGKCGYAVNFKYCVVKD